MVLALESGIAPSAWWREDERDLATALDVLAKQRRATQNSRRRPEDAEGRVTSG